MDRFQCFYKKLLEPIVTVAVLLILKYHFLVPTVKDRHNIEESQRKDFFRFGLRGGQICPPPHAISALLEPMMIGVKTPISK